MKAILTIILFSCLAGPAAADPVWNLEPPTLFEGQDQQDLKTLVETLDHTRSVAQAIEQYLRANGVLQLAMIRYKHGYETLWLLYRSQEKTFIVELTLTGKRMFSHYMREIAPSDWNNTFDKLLNHRQKRASQPLPDGEYMQSGRVWTRGYTGIANIYNDGQTRTYLLATQDISVLNVRNPAEKLLCSTVFAGLHCSNGAYLTDGWVQQNLNALLKRTESGSYNLIDLGQELPAIVSSAFTR